MQRIKEKRLTCLCKELVIWYSHKICDVIYVIYVMIILYNVFTTCMPISLQPTVAIWWSLIFCMTCVLTLYAM
jgi:hypothetical protein